MRDDPSVIYLVSRAQDGDQGAWNALVHRYAPLVWSICRRHHLSGADASDVSQTVWLRLVEHLADLREPQALPGWLVTTTRSECCRYHRHARRILLVDPHRGDVACQGAEEDPESGILQAELRQALREGLDELPIRDQQLLRLRATDPPTPYCEISKLLGMPVGSIGPGIRRSLDKLRRTLAVQAYIEIEESGVAGRATGPQLVS